MQQALVMAPQRGLIHSGFLMKAFWFLPPSPMGVAVLGPCMWACMRTRERQRHGLFCEERGAGAACETSKAEVTCMARLVACLDAMAAGQGSGRVVGVHALWTIVRHTEDEEVKYAFSLCPAACVCMLASSGERDTFGGV
jgi:hypothetical protein